MQQQNENALPLHSEHLQQAEVLQQQTAAAQQKASQTSGSDNVEGALEVADIAVDVATEPGLMSDLADGISSLASGAADMAGAAVSGALEAAGDVLGGLLS